MRFARVRSSVAETHHEVGVAAIGPDGQLLFASGDTERLMLYRSSIKPFQALAAHRTGFELPSEYLAVTCSSHGGYPVHIAIVEQILADAGLTNDHLQCPAAWPTAIAARDRLIAEGRSRPERRLHNCSGKHAGWLAACVHAGLPIDTYLAADHPLQRSVVELVSEGTGVGPEPTGVDGCGAPTLRGTVVGLARGYAHITSEPEFAPIVTAMSSYGALIADNVRSDGRFAANWGGISKIGATGVFAAGLHGLGIAAKAHDGDPDVAVAAVIETTALLGVLPDGTAEWLAEDRNPAVLGGGRPVGSLELIEA